MEPSISFATAGLFWFFIILLVIWSFIWKGIALWHSAKRGEKWWFVGLIIIQTAGILEILYLAFVAKIWSNKATVATNVPPIPVAPSPVPPVTPTPATPTPAVATPTPIAPTTPEVKESTTN